MQADLIYEKIIINKEKNKQFRILTLVNNKVLHFTYKNIYIMSLNLSMIVKLRLYISNQLDDFFLNDKKVIDNLMID